MLKYMLSVPAMVALTACVPVGEAPESPGGSPAAGAYLALGTEPGWTLEITPARLNYHGDYGETRIVVANPGARPSFNGARYVTDRLSVDVTHAECSDGMSDRRFADSVTVKADGREVKGCGGAILPPADLAGTAWKIISFGGTDVPAGVPTELRFDGKRVSGQAGCNRFSGSYTSDGKRLTTGPLMATKMACPGPGMALESGFLTLMNGPVSLRFTPEGRLVLMGIGGVSAVLAPVI